MKTLLFLLMLHGQPARQPSYTCPSAYTMINPTTPVSGLSYVDSPAPGAYCYVGISTDGNSTSSSSNTAGPFVVAATNTVTLTWNAPSTGSAPTGYIIARALAIAHRRR